MTTVPEGSIVITPGEVYAKVVTLTEVVTQLVAADTAETEARAELKSRVTKVEEKVSAMERKLWFIAGIAAAAGGGFGSLIAPALVK